MKFLFGYVGIIVGLALVVHAYQSFKNDHPTVEKCKSILKILRDAKYKFDEFELCLNEIMRGKMCHFDRNQIKKFIILASLYSLNQATLKQLHDISIIIFKRISRRLRDSSGPSLIDGRPIKLMRRTVVFSKYLENILLIK